MGVFVPLQFCTMSLPLFLEILASSALLDTIDYYKDTYLLFRSSLDFLWNFV